jgi:hypothetical protein
MNGLFFRSDVPGLRVEPEDETPGFRFTPQVVLPGFNLYGTSDQERNWPDGTQPGLMTQYPDLAQTLASHTARLAAPGSGDLARPPLPTFPD